MSTSAKIELEAKNVADELQSDVLLINAPITSDLAKAIRDRLRERPDRAHGPTRLLLILATYGGDPHAAYDIARCLQRNYSEFEVCVAGDCYSAGTLIVLGARSIYMGDEGKLGPLDVQLLKKDAINERLSGLTLKIALEELQTRAYETFQMNLENLISGFRNQISLQTAFDVASKMTTNLYSEIFRQIDPIKIGDDARALHIADHYGKRLVDKSKNAKQNAIDRLLYDFPAHECFVDMSEASDFFHRVNEPGVSLLNLIETLDDWAKVPNEQQTAVFLAYYNQPADNSEHGQYEHHGAAAENGQAGEGRRNQEIGAAGEGRGVPEETHGESNSAPKTQTGHVRP